MKVAVPRGFQMRSCGKYNHVQYAHKMEDGDRQVKAAESEGYKELHKYKKNDSCTNRCISPNHMQTQRRKEKARKDTESRRTESRYIVGE